MKELGLKLKQLIYFVLIYLFRLFPIKHNKIFLFSYYGSQYGCNPKYITEYILKNYPKETYDIVWAFNHVDERKNLEGFRKVKTMSLKYFYELSTSKIVITNFRTTDLFIKRNNQYYIQTWHSSLRLKQIEKDAEDFLSPHYVQMAKKDSLKCDLLLSGCKYSTEIFKRAFWYDGEIFEHGTPRNDVLFQDKPETKKRIIERINIPSDYKVILYAPTFRKDNNLDVYDLEYKRIKEALEDRFGGRWMFLVKLHPHLASKSGQLVYGEKVLDVSTYDDIQELLCIADILISDYSSLMFDFSITDRPCFLYVPDAKEYISKERNLYFELMELPFITASSNNDLVDKIRSFDPLLYKSQLNCFLDKVGSFEDGNSSEHLLERIDEICFERKGGKVYETA